MFDLIQYGSKPCLEGSNKTLSYRELYQAVESMRQICDGRKLILCICENSLPAIVGYVCFMVNGQIPILIDEAQRPEAVKQIIAAHDPEYAWVPETHVAQLAGGKVIHRIDHYVLVRLPHRDNTVPHSELQLMLSTSGSTGSSKFVRVSRKNIEANAASIIEYLGICSSDVAITTLPFSYSFGLSIINTHLFAGATIQVTEHTPLQREFWNVFINKGVTSLSGVPYTWEMLKRIKFERFNLDALRYLSQAGGRMSDEGLAYILRVSQERGWPCFLMYGQTEATARMSYLPPELLAKKPTSIGRPIPDGRFEIISESGQVCNAAHEKGELVYYGPNVTLGYASTRAHLAEEDEWRGRLYTGDIGYMDYDGHYYIVGRTKRFAKLFGKRVSLDEVEVLLQRNFKGIEFFCFGYDDSLRVAIVGPADEDKVTSLLSQQLTIHRSAIRSLSIQEAPRLNNGKVNYAALKELFG